MRYIFNIIFKKRIKPNPLGRWEHRITEEKKEIKSILSNLDNCGDKICGNPLLYKSLKYKKIIKN